MPEAAEFETRKVSLAKWWNPFTWGKFVILVSFNILDWEMVLSNMSISDFAGSESEPGFFYDILKRNV